MIDHQYAVIDLGTNTFHLLIAERTEDGQLKEIYRERVYIKLAEGGIKTISAVPFQRGLDAMLHFSQILHNKFPTASVVAFGTAALRTAVNANQFIDQIKSKMGIQVQIISGHEEARLIYVGVSQIVNFYDKHDLIMDIGGGSVEFIIANQSGIQWSQSFPIGVAVLFQNFHKSDPISITEIETLRDYLSKILQPLTEAIESYSVIRLIGASGTFDVLESNLPKQKTNSLQSTIDIKDYFPFHNQIIQLTLEERMALKNLPISRADMIVVALLLIHEIIDLAQIQQIIVSTYAMKEGMLKEISS